jgi:hypothetical protein
VFCPAHHRTLAATLRCLAWSGQGGAARWLATGVAFEIKNAAVPSHWERLLQAHSRSLRHMGKKVLLQLVSAQPHATGLPCAWLQLPTAHDSLPRYWLGSGTFEGGSWSVPQLANTLLSSTGWNWSNQTQGVGCNSEVKLGCRPIQ